MNQPSSRPRFSFQPKGVVTDEVELSEDTPAASNVTPIESGRKAKKSTAPKEEGSKDEQSIEYAFCDYVRRGRPYLRIGGVIGDKGSDAQSLDKTLYEYSQREGYWVLKDPDALQAEALEWLALGSRANYKAQTAKSCVATLLCEMHNPERSRFHLPKATQGLMTSDGFVRIHADGSLSMEPASLELGATFKINASVPGARMGSFELPSLDPNCRFARYLNDVMPDTAIQAVLQEALGSTLVDFCIGKALWFKGGGANGKSTMMELMQALHPRHTAFELSRFGDRFSTACLQGKTLVCIAEAPNGRSAFDESVFKAYVTRDPMTGEKKGENAYTFRPVGTVLMAMNDFPIVKDHSDGFWRRVLTFGFDQTIPEHKRIAGLHKLIINDPKEFSQFVGWLIAGASRLLQRTRFLTEEELPASMKVLATTMRSSTDATEAFVEEYSVASGDYAWSKDDLYASFRTWCDHVGRQAMGRDRFLQSLYSKLEKKSGRRPEEQQISTAGGQRHRVVWLSVDELKDHAAKTPLKPLRSRASAPTAPKVVKPTPVQVPQVDEVAGAQVLVEQKGEEVCVQLTGNDDSLTNALAGFVHFLPMFHQQWRIDSTTPGRCLLKGPLTAWPNLAQAMASMNQSPGTNWTDELIPF
jgi:P4 family phage/plasmid primase-like protien